jgi:hypothetical protein
MVDYGGVLNVPEWAAGHHMSVAIEVDAKARWARFIFGSWEHHSKRCRCIQPSTPEAQPFGPTLSHLTHFSARNVAEVPLACIVRKLGSQMVSVDLFDALDEICQYADLTGLKKRMRIIPPR